MTKKSFPITSATTIFLLILLPACSKSPHPDPVSTPAAAPIQPDVAEDASQYLGEIYKDDAAGIRIAPPRGSALAFQGRGEILSFKIEEKTWVGDLITVNLRSPTAVEKYLNLSVTQLTKDFKGVQVLESRQLTFQNHKAGRLITTMEANIAPKPATQKQIITILRQQLIIQMSDSKFLTLQFYTPLKDKKIAEATFTAMLTKFELIDNKPADKLPAQAINQGKYNAPANPRSLPQFKKNCEI